MWVNCGLLQYASKNSNSRSCRLTLRVMSSRAPENLRSRVLLGLICFQATLIFGVTAAGNKPNCAHVAFNMSAVLVQKIGSHPTIGGCRTLCNIAFKDIERTTGPGTRQERAKHLAIRYKNNDERLNADICSKSNRYCMGKKWFGTLDPITLQINRQLERSTAQCALATPIRKVCACKFRLELFLVRLANGEKPDDHPLYGHPKSQSDGPRGRDCTLELICKRLSSRYVYPSSFVQAHGHWQCDSRQEHMSILARISCLISLATEGQPGASDGNKVTRCQCNLEGYRNCYSLLAMPCEDQSYFYTSSFEFLIDGAYFDSLQSAVEIEIPPINNPEDGSQNGQDRGLVRNLDLLQQVFIPIVPCDQTTDDSCQRKQPIQTHHVRSLGELGIADQPSSSKRARTDEDGSVSTNAATDCKGNETVGLVRQQGECRLSQPSFDHGDLDVAAEEHYLYDDEMVKLVNTIIEGPNQKSKQHPFDQGVFPVIAQLQKNQMQAIDNLDEIPQISEGQQSTENQRSVQESHKHTQSIARMALLSDMQSRTPEYQGHSADGNVDWEEFDARNIESSCDYPEIGREADEDFFRLYGDSDPMNMFDKFL